MNNLEFEAMEDYFINEREPDMVGHRILEGINTIILTAPHSVSQLREGKIKAGEFRTGPIVKILGQMSQCHIAFKTKNLGDDANYNPKCNFKDDLINYVKDKGIKLVLDFHISRPEREFSIDIGTGRGANIDNREDILHCIKEHLETKYENIKTDEVFSAKYPHTVSATVSRETGIPAFQIEINWNLIDDYNKTDEFIKTMLEIINKLEEII